MVKMHNKQQNENIPMYLKQSWMARLCPPNQFGASVKFCSAFSVQQLHCSAVQLRREEKVQVRWLWTTDDGLGGARAQSASAVTTYLYSLPPYPLPLPLNTLIPLTSALPLPSYAFTIFARCLSSTQPSV